MSHTAHLKNGGSKTLQYQQIIDFPFPDQKQTELSILFIMLLNFSSDKRPSFKSMIKFENLKFSDLEVLETIAETHAATTKIYLTRHQGQLQICKAISKQSVRHDAKAIEHLQNQKQALKHFTSLHNSNICSLLGTAQDQSNAYLILEMVEGLPLHRLLKMTGPLSRRFATVVLAQIAEIMRQFHEEGFIYRDIKSSNFMVSQIGKVKMIDLGKAKLIKKGRAFSICGTTHAMPPDIYKKEGYSYEFDYYSFGVLVYELLVGTSPFGYGGSNKEILDDVMAGISETAMSKLPDEEAQDLVKKLVISDPTKRLGGFQQILNHPFFEEDRQFAVEVLKGEDEMSRFDPDFSEYISQIEDFGLDFERFEEVKEDDPFYKFLQK